MPAGNTIGQAYVQILPSMNGFSKAMNTQGGAEMDAAGGSAGKKFGSKLVGIAGKVIAGAAIGKTIKDSIDAGGALQQSMGGIETLFGKSADIVKKNASQAFKTAGMSANEYMENTTSFAASLISSTGGNTQKAAKLADTAMKDMSDNANKMGTDLGSITQTYQSLARGNYAMLDNLKLGYGGTKSEMERLMSDAEKLTGEHYTVGDFGDTVAAIHAVQENLKITGTTAKEASTTMSGSMNMMKSAWTDFLGNLAIGGDVTGSLKNLLSSVKTFLIGNLLPMIGTIFTSIGTIIQQTDWGAVGKSILNGLINGINSAISTFSSVASSIAGYISSIDWVATGQKLLTGLFTLVKSIDWGALVNAALTLVGTALSAGLSLLSGVIIQAGTWIGNIFKQMANVAVQAWNNLKAKAVTIWNNIKSAISNALMAALAKVVSIWKTIETAIGKTVIKIKMSVKQGFENIKTTATNIFNNLKTSVSNAWNKIKEAITKPIDKAKEKVKAAIDKIKSIVSGVKLELPHFKLPHFHLSGGQAPFGLGGKGSLPHFSVDWYAKGGIFDSESIIGYGVGEKGAEAIVPLDRFWNKLDKIADNSSSGDTNNITINVQASPGMNTRELAAEVERRLINSTNRRRLAW